MKNAQISPVAENRYRIELPLSLHKTLTLSKALTLTLALIFLSPIAGVQAEVYRQVLSDGTVVFSDEASPNAQKIEVKPLPSINLHPTQSFQPTNRAMPTSGSADKPYQSVTISSPADDQAVADGAGLISVSVQVSPRLKSGHKVQLKIDGKAAGPASANTSFNLSNVHRGTHTLSANILDGNGKTVLSGPSSIFHMIRPIVRR